MNSEKIAMDFWYELDYYSNDYTRYGGGYSDLSKEMNDAISVLKNFYFSNYTQLRSGSTTFVNIIGKGRKNPDIDDAVKLVSKRVKDIMTYHFGKDLDQEQSKSLQEQAFIYFGQGTLFDDTPSNRTPSRTRRPLDFMVHMMDGAVAFYAFWHFIINYYDIITLHEDNTFWTQLDKYLGLGAEIHHKKNPKQSDDPRGINPKNSKIDNKTLDWLKAKWLLGTDMDETSAHLILLLK